MLTLKNKTVQLILLSFLSALISSLAWQSTYFFWLEIISYVPFFFALFLIRKRSTSFYKKMGLLALVVFSFRVPLLIIGANWLVTVSIGTLSLLILFDIIFLFLILIPVLFKRLSFLSVVFLFILFEYLMQHILMMSPFYLMGYSMGSHVSVIQYYSVLGVEGGSAIIYFFNYAVFNVIKNKAIKQFEIIVFSIFIGLTGYSLINYYFAQRLPLDSNKKIAIAHTETLFYKDIYLKKPIILVDTINSITPKNSLVITPEGFFNRFGWLEGLNKSLFVKKIDSIYKAGNKELLAGANLFSVTHKITPQTRFTKKYNVYYNVNNTSLLFGTIVRVKSKQKFVPFLEYVPNNPIAQWINTLIPVVGDNKKLTPLNLNQIFKYKGLRFNILLCYGSVYPLLIAKKALKSDFLVIQANEYWNHSERLSQVYFNINRILAVQSGIPVYRTSNYGYSAVIMPNGDVIKKAHRTDQEFSALIGHLPYKMKSSFYNKIAGYSYLLSFISILILIGQCFFYKRK